MAPGNCGIDCHWRLRPSFGISGNYRSIGIDYSPRVESISTNQQSKFLGDDDPEYHIQPVLEILETIEEEFSENESIVELISRQIRTVKDWIEENTVDRKINEREKLGNDSVSPKGHEDRSIFDDVGK